MDPFEVSGWRSQGHLFQGPLHVWGLAQGLPATQEQQSSLFGGGVGLGSLTPPLVTAASLGQYSETALWSSEQQAFLHQLPGTPAKMLTCSVSNENRNTLLCPHTSGLLPSSHSRSPVPGAAGVQDCRDVPHQGPNQVLCHDLCLCFCLSPRPPQSPSGLDPYLTPTVRFPPSDL